MDSGILNSSLLLAEAKTRSKTVRFPILTLFTISNAREFDHEKRDFFSEKKLTKRYDVLNFLYMC